jgi:hypothetical protein
MKWPATRRAAPAAGKTGATCAPHIAHGEWRLDRRHFNRIWTPPHRSPVTFMRRAFFRARR